jgi:hypothetical protein
MFAGEASMEGHPISEVLAAALGTASLAAPALNLCCIAYVTRFHPGITEKGKKR